MPPLASLQYGWREAGPVDGVELCEETVSNGNVRPGAITILEHETFTQHVVKC